MSKTQNKNHSSICAWPKELNLFHGERAFEDTMAAYDGWKAETCDSYDMKYYKNALSVWEKQL